jgi:integrase
LPDSRQVQRKIGPAWSDRGRPPAGYFTKRLAEDWLRDVIDQARRGTLAGMVRTGASFADAAAEWLRYIEHDRGRKPSTLQGYRSTLKAAFTGLRMGELLALCWRDFDFTGAVIRVRASYYLGSLTTPKSGKVRAVPMAPDVASALAQLGQRYWRRASGLVLHSLSRRHRNDESRS